MNNKQIKKFTKKELIKSEKFTDYVDVLQVILEHNKNYSVEETEKLINKFLKGRVN